MGSGYKVINHPNGTVFHKFNGELHNENGPAIQRPDGSQVWCWHGNPHRLDGPASVNPSEPEKNAWFIYGKQYTEQEFIFWSKTHNG